MSDGSLFDLSAFGRETPTPATTQWEHITTQIADVINRTTFHPDRETLEKMLAAVVLEHINHAPIDGELAISPDTGRQWLEAIEAADPDIARFTRALKGPQ